MNARSRIFRIVFCLCVAPAAARADSLRSYLPPDFASDCAHLFVADTVLDPDVENTALNDIGKVLFREVIGQDAGLHALLDSIEVASAGIQDVDRPLSRNLYLGPTGVGKTETMKALVRALGGDPEYHLIRIDCGEFQKGHEISALIGATASYAGYGDKPKFHQSELDARKLPFRMASGEIRHVNVVLFDELEKCHDDVFKLMMHILDNGRATMGDNSTSSFRNALIGASSNLGAQAAEEAIKRRQSEVARLDPLAATPAELDVTGRLDPEFARELDQIYQTAVDLRFKPEFRARWEAIIRYAHLSAVEYPFILDKQLARVQREIFHHGLKKIGLFLTPELRADLIRRGTDPLNGARRLETLVKKRVRRPLARLMVTGQVLDGDVVLARPDGERSRWEVGARGLDRDQALRFARATYPKFFDAFDWDPAKGQPAKPAADLITLLNQNPSVVADLYKKASGSSVQLRERVGNLDGPNMSTKYVRIDQAYVRLELHAGGAYRASAIAEDSMHVRALGERITVKTEAEVRDAVAQETP